jgi:hypothetical protein
MVTMRWLVGAWEASPEVTLQGRQRQAAAGNQQRETQLSATAQGTCAPHTVWRRLAVTANPFTSAHPASQPASQTPIQRGPHTPRLPT